MEARLHAALARSSRCRALEVGRTYTVAPFPFKRETYLSPEDGSDVVSWAPGVRFEPMPYGENAEAVADGEGAMLLTVVSLHKPGRYPTRVFYTRQWRDPDGKVFGDTKLRVTVVSAFRRRLTGYLHEYRVEQPEAASCA